LSGHSKWSQIKRKKAVNDQQRGKMISKHIRAIQAAVRSGGGGDPSANLSLKNALAAAKSDSVPQENIDRAIERALGGGEGGYDEVTYEGYGVAGVALLVEALTDNRNRTAADIRHVFSKYGGNMSGSVAWQFDSKGVIELADASEKTQELAIELGAEDLEVEDSSEGKSLTIYTAPEALYTVADGLQAQGLEPEVQLTKLPQNEVELSPEDIAKLMHLIEALEDLDDVQNVYSSASLDNLNAVEQQ
jgi:YebC/PmpR family DNA-binding regulatory protein